MTGRSSSAPRVRLSVLGAAVTARGAVVVRFALDGRAEGVSLDPDDVTVEAAGGARPTSVSIHRAPSPAGPSLFDCVIRFDRRAADPFMLRVRVHALRVTTAAGGADEIGGPWTFHVRLRERAAGTLDGPGDPPDGAAGHLRRTVPYGRALLEE